MQLNTQNNLSVLKYLQMVVFGAVILMVGKTLFIPLFFGLLTAIVLYPVCKWLEQHGLPRPVSIMLCLLIVSVLFALLFALLVWQVNLISKDAPALLVKAATVMEQGQHWLYEKTGMTNGTAIDWNQKITNNTINVIQSAFGVTMNTLFMLFLTPVFTALFMYHRATFTAYLKLVIPVRYRQQTNVILKETAHTYFNYIKGMVLVYIIVGILNSIGLYLLGVQNAFLFGMLCAVMTIVPYVGIFVSALLPISYIWLQTGNIWYPLGVVAVFSIVQYLEANVIFPKVVGAQLNVSTMAMLIAVIAGGIVWGIAGMILFIPFAAILKIITGHIEEWKALNLLLSRK